MDSISSTAARAKPGCFLCRQVEQSVECDKCQAVWFCATHRPLHREIVDQEGRCYPYRVAESLKRGRHLVATRDLEAGSLVFRESPVLLGPLHETPPVCLGCFRPLTEDTTRLCFSCHLPLCTEEDHCSHRDLHVNFECSVLANLGDDKASSLVAEALESHRIYQCIAPLRVLLLKDSHPDKWAAVKAMMDHVEEKRHEPHWQEVQANVVRYICGFLGNRFSPEEVNHVVGVLEVNAFEVKTDEGHVARGLYPLTALMSHECLSNTRYIFREGTLESECRTTIPISKGKEILDHYVSPLEGTRFRQKRLREGWCFDCDCQRCSDPTELQTNFSSAICGNCNGQGVRNQLERRVAME